MLIIIRLLSVIFLFVFTFSFSSYAANRPVVSADSAILIDAETREILFEKNAYEVRSMASTTKIMTTILAIESGKLNNKVVIRTPPYTEGTAVGFSKGDTITLETLCYGMLLESGNDAAVLTAEFLSGSEEEFSKLMNIKADEIGMSNTNFVTASGLDSEGHSTTAYDMALLGAYAVENEMFVKICSTKTYNAEFINSEKVRTFYNHNRLLDSCEGVFGIKTGFTKKSGRCLVTACKRNGKTLVCVTLNAPDDWNDHKKLYDYGYSLYEQVILKADFPEKIKIFGADSEYAKIKLTTETVMLKADTIIDYKIYLNRYLYAPIKKNDAVGKIVFYVGNYKITECALVSVDNIEAQDGEEYTSSFFERIKEYILNFIKKRKDRYYDRRKSQASEIPC